MAKWLKENDELLRKLFPSELREKVLEFFPNRSWMALTRRASYLKIERFKDKNWSDKELTILIHAWAQHKPRYEIESLLPKRTWTAIGIKASLLNLSGIKIERPIISGQKVKVDISHKGKVFKFGIVSDTHFGSKYAQITYLHQMYKRFKQEGITTVIHAGDVSEGNGTHFQGQKFEMHIVGADNLKNFIIKAYPKVEGIKTYVVAGYHDLDLWTHEGYNLLQAVGDNREDIVYLGDASVTLDILGRKFEIMHPSGGTAYALSYRLQKIVEGFSSENKPHILIVGHFHKAEYIPVLRNVYAFQAACFQSQTPFAKRKNLYWHYGGWIVEMGLKDEGISSMKAEFIPFYKPIMDDYRNYE